MQEAFAAALERWPRDGAPANPGAWLLTTARNRAIDRIRRNRTLAEKTKLLERLSQVEALESYLHKAFLGKKQFSIEGLDVTVPMLDEALEWAAKIPGAQHGSIEVRPVMVFEEADS